MKTGQAAENQRVGQLLNDILNQALQIDWRRQATRRSAAPLPPLSVSVANLPLIERLRAKSLEGDTAQELLLTTQYAQLADMDAEFWQAFEGLDTEALRAQTLALLEARGQPLTLAELAQTLPPGEHDLETLAQWLAWAGEGGGDAQALDQQHIELQGADGRAWRFTVPRVEVSAEVVKGMEA